MRTACVRCCEILIGGWEGAHGWFCGLTRCVVLAACAARIKAHELRDKSKGDLLNTLKDLKTELGALRVAKVTGGAPNKLSKIKIVRKSVARVLTVFRQNQRKALKSQIETDSKNKKVGPR